MQSFDIVVIGAGPAGLYAAYYAGFRGFSVAVIDALPEAGGQVTAMYPEKDIFDIAGFPKVKGRELVDGLMQQAQTFSPTMMLGEQVTEMLASEDSVGLKTAAGVEVSAKAVIITGGIGAFAPRPIPVGMEWLDKGLIHFVPRLADHAGKDVVIIDDMCDTAGTLTTAADLLIEKGAKSVRAFTTHAVLSGPAFERIAASKLTELIVTDTIPLQKHSDKIRVVSVAELFADVIKRLVNNESISSHFVIS